jgi:GTPase SAR1 family protein
VPPRKTAREWRELAPDEDPFGEAPWPESPNGKPAGGGGQSASLYERLRRGDVILDEPATPPALWGNADDILWAAGESLIICGPDGVGKTTLAGNLIRARLGIGDGKVLGLPVAECKWTEDGVTVLVLLMDRPRQARRALRRLFTEDDREILRHCLKIWEGPPPLDLARYPMMLADLARVAGAAPGGTVVVDSLKDAALKLTDDETGSGWNRARQNVIQAGAELIELHHPRKAQSDNRRPAKLEDLYGSRWITAGAGSVISLWGEPGDLVVEFTHLKAPAGQAGPWLMALDPAAGTVRIDRPAVDLIEQIRYRPRGITAEIAAGLLFGDATRSSIEKARYRLNKKVAEGILYRRDGTRGGRDGGEPAAWFLAASDQETSGGERSEKRSESDQAHHGPERSESGGCTSSPLSDRSPAGSEPAS